MSPNLATPKTAAARTQLGLLILLNATALAGDTVFWIRFVRKMRGFDFFVSQILYPISAAVLLSPALLSLRCARRLDMAHNCRFPRRYIFALAVLGCGTNWGLAAAATLLPETLVTITMRLSTVFVLVQSVVILGTRFRWTHVLGAIVVSAAAITDVLWGSSGSAGSNAHTGGNHNSSSISSSSNHTLAHHGPSLGHRGRGGSYAIGVLVLLAVCFSPKGVLTEKWVKTYRGTHPAFLRWCTACATVCLGVLLCPLAFVRTSTHAPVPMTGPGVASYLRAACGCFAGYPQPETHPNADCAGAYIIYLCFIICNLTFDTTGIAIEKRGSAAIGAVGSSMSLVLTIMLTQIPFLSGLAQPAPLNGATFLSVAMVILGLALYALKKEMPREEYATEIHRVVDKTEADEQMLQSDRLMGLLLGKEGNDGRRE